MAAAKFKKGDQVQLLSGGPSMVVNSVYAPDASDKDYVYSCKWFAGANVKHANFSEPTLKEFESVAKK